MLSTNSASLNPRLQCHVRFFLPPKLIALSDNSLVKIIRMFQDEDWISLFGQSCSDIHSVKVVYSNIIRLDPPVLVELTLKFVRVNYTVAIPSSQYKFNKRNSDKFAELLTNKMILFKELYIDPV